MGIISILRYKVESFHIFLTQGLKLLQKAKQRNREVSGQRISKRRPGHQLQHGIKELLEDEEEGDDMADMEQRIRFYTWWPWLV